MAPRFFRWSLCLLTLAPAVAACGDDPLAPEDRLEQTAESEHFVVFAAEDDSVDLEYQERHFAWAMAKLELSYGQRLRYHKYRDVDHLERVTDRRTNGFAEPDDNVFHTIWPKDNHEYLHVVFATQVGKPPGLFSEGVAVAHHGASIRGELEGDPLWNGTSAHEQCRQFLLGGTMPELGAIAVNHAFRLHDDQISYAIAGSFVRFLIDEAGVAPFKRFASRVGRGSDLERIESDFAGVYDESLSTWWQRWQDFLRVR